MSHRTLFCAWLVLSGCVEAGDRNVQGRLAEEGSVCVQHCATIAEAGCNESPTCETNCKARLEETPSCAFEIDVWLECTRSPDKVACDARDDAIAPSCDRFNDDAMQCELQARGEACVLDDSPGAMARCDGCCDEAFAEASQQWYALLSDCECRECATECEEMCSFTGLSGTACDDCALAKECFDEADSLCMGDAQCSPYVDCYWRCAGWL